MKKKSLLKLSSLVFTTILLTSCAQDQPRNINNACSIIHEYPSWYYDMVDSYKRWGIPLNIQLAFIRQESSFIADAQPPMKYFLGFIPIGRASSAYGYPQALDGTWDHYKQSTDQTFVSRSDFADATDFIGWYLDDVHEKAKISKTDSYDLYLAYHEGVYGYMKNTHKNNTFLKNYARKTKNWANLYSKQLRQCEVPDKPFLSYF